MNTAGKLQTILVAAMMAMAAAAETQINISGVGADKKFLVEVDVSDTAFRRTLERNLVLSGAFRLVKGAPIKVAGAVGDVITVDGNGKRITLNSVAKDDKAARAEARSLSDRMVESYAGQKGFAQKRLAFVMKTGKGEELLVGYADGCDIRQVTHDNKASVGPRWKDANSLYYTGYINNAPQVFEIDADTGRRSLRWGFGGLTTGAAVAPGKSTVALIISKPFRNPELCTIEPAAGTWRRLTMTKGANEGQPAWSPDGSHIAYVSDETRRQHIFTINPVTKDKRRLTSQGNNVDPDWGPDGRIVYTTRRAGQSQIAVMTSADGDKSAQLVTEPGTWEHPTWAADGRHVVAERDGALFMIDTLEGGDEPRQLFTLSGKCITPSFLR